MSYVLAVQFCIIAIKFCHITVQFCPISVLITLLLHNNIFAGLYDYQPKEHVFLFGLSREQRQCINVMVWTDNMLEEGETFRVSLSYDDDDMAPLNISRPYSLIHIEDNSDGIYGYIGWLYTQ